MSEKATFGAGCFWGVEVEFRNVPGVVDAQVGYTGGDLQQPTYEQVCSGMTGHAEAVEVEFDPEQVSYRELVEKFWNLHDPTQVNRQGPDVGSQYRSVIFTHSDEQREQAIQSLQALQGRSKKAIATQIVPAEPFWPAEDYHQQYLVKRGLASCRV